MGYIYEAITTNIRGITSIASHLSFLIFGLTIYTYLRYQQFRPADSNFKKRFSNWPLLHDEYKDHITLTSRKRRSNPF